MEYWFYTELASKMLLNERSIGKVMDFPLLKTFFVCTCLYIIGLFKRHCRFLSTLNIYKNIPKLTWNSAAKNGESYGRTTVLGINGTWIYRSNALFFVSWNVWLCDLYLINLRC